jgi:hypothetical protein
MERTFPREIQAGDSFFVREIRISYGGGHG